MAYFGLGWEISFSLKEIASKEASGTRGFRSIGKKREGASLSGGASKKKSDPNGREKKKIALGGKKRSTSCIFFQGIKELAHKKNIYDPLGKKGGKFPEKGLFSVKKEKKDFLVREAHLYILLGRKRGKVPAAERRRSSFKGGYPTPTLGQESAVRVGREKGSPHPRARKGAIQFRKLMSILTWVRWGSSTSEGGNS